MGPSSNLSMLSLCSLSLSATAATHGKGWAPSRSTSGVPRLPLPAPTLQGSPRRNGTFRAEDGVAVREGPGASTWLEQSRPSVSHRRRAHIGNYLFFLLKLETTLAILSPFNSPGHAALLLQVLANLFLCRPRTQSMPWFMPSLATVIVLAAGIHL